PLASRVDLVAALSGSPAVSSAFPSTLKTGREAAVRALAETANTRTWNLMIDLVAQSGRYPEREASSSGDPFVVEGERRYWLHIAIDRYTGEIVDQQLELVSE
ncbi:MAG TPA: hypothetical protein VIM58_06130, partial [Candidatus Methylacidiphilales bacterium]